MAFEDRYVLALAAIVFAAILDGIDGRMARLLKGTSRFGAELDSLSDFVNFGVAPALILYFWGLHELKSAGWIAAMVFAICAGLRLARFNVMIDDPDRPAWASNFFVGMPAPAGAITVLLPIYAVFLGLPRSRLLIWLTLVYTLGIASADGVAAAGVLRQARRHARAARDGGPAHRRGGAVHRAADRLSVGAAHSRHARLSRQACRSAGCPIASTSGARARAGRMRRPPLPCRLRRSPRASCGPPTATIVHRASIEPHHRDRS